jgi:hypothetical protein
VPQNGLLTIPDFLNDSDDEPLNLDDSDDMPSLPDDPADDNRLHEVEHYESSVTFMPGSTPAIVNGSRVLCWNAWGCCVLKMDDIGMERLEITPSDTAEFYATPIDDLTGIIAATVDDHGFSYATSTTVTYRKHTNGRLGTVVCQFPQALENVEVIAIGSGWFATATGMNRLHIFTDAGIPITVFVLDGRILTMIGQQKFLFVVYGANHKFELFDVIAESSIAQGFVPLRPPLRWAGFDVETDSVLIAGGNYVVSTLTGDFGNRWTPVLDLRPRLHPPFGSFAIVEVALGKLKGAFLGCDSIPDPMKATLEEFDLAPLALNHDQGRCIQAMHRRENARALDRALLVQMSAALEQDRLLMAVQVGGLIATETGRALAIRRAEQTGHRSVGERLTERFTELHESSDTETESDEPEPPPFVRIEEARPEEEEVRECEEERTPAPAEIETQAQTETATETATKMDRGSRKRERRHKKHDNDDDNDDQEQKQKQEQKRKKKRDDTDVGKSDKRDKREKRKVQKPKGVSSLAAFGFT